MIRDRFHLTKQIIIMKWRNETERYIAITIRHGLLGTGIPKEDF